jgi:hypothetical protein
VFVSKPAEGEPAGYEAAHLMVFSSSNLGSLVLVIEWAVVVLLSVIEHILCEKGFDQLFHDFGILWKTTNLTLKIRKIVVNSLFDSETATVGIAIGVIIGVTVGVAICVAIDMAVTISCIHVGW